MYCAGERPYVCRYCGKAFNQTNSHQKHERTMHPFGFSTVMLEEELVDAEDTDTVYTLETVDAYDAQCSEAGVAAAHKPDVHNTNSNTNTESFASNTCQTSFSIDEHSTLSTVSRLALDPKNSSSIGSNSSPFAPVAPLAPFAPHALNGLVALYALYALNAANARSASPTLPQLLLLLQHLHLRLQSGLVLRTRLTYLCLWT